MAKFDPGKFSLFEEGVLQLDVNKVREAMDAGIPGDTLVMMAGQRWHPLEITVHTQALNILAAEKAREGNPITRRQAAELAGGIADLLLERGVDLVTPYKYAAENERVLMDMVIQGDRFDLISAIVVQAINQSFAQGGKPYEPDTKSFVQARLIREKQDEDKTGIVSTACRDLAAVQHFVKRRLEDPSSPAEVALAGKIGQLGFWDREPEALYQQHLVAPETSVSSGQTAAVLRPAAHFESASGGGAPPTAKQKIGF